jgi:hypothetical protein
LKARHLKIGLIVGAIWGLSSTVVFVAVGMFGSENHPYRWLYESFQASFDTLWFKAIFLPFIVPVETFFGLNSSLAMYAIFASIPFGAIVGIAVGVLTSVMSYLIQKQETVSKEA